MRTLRYLKNGETLVLREAECVNCGECVEVCPHAVFAMAGSSARIIDRGACMECGACALNCPAKAISVKVGVGCAAAIIIGKLRGTAPTCGSDCGGGAKDAGRGKGCC